VLYSHGGQIWFLPLTTGRGEAGPATLYNA
jgi:hypothetical protein